jgi:hypothetical protein
LDFDAWRNAFAVTLVEVLGFMLLMKFFCLFLAQRVPDFLMIMSCPPYLDEENLLILTYGLSYYDKTRDGVRITRQGTGKTMRSVASTE